MFLGPQLRWHLNCLFAATIILGGSLANSGLAEDFHVGFSKVEITPTKPLRLSGYASRKAPFEGIDEKLFVRTTVIKQGDHSKVAIVSVETIGFPAEVTNQILDELKPLGFSREQVAVCMTHCHSAPHISGGLNNLFQPPLTEVQQRDTDAYTALVIAGVIQAVKSANTNTQPAIISVGSGKVGFARNRRVIQDGIWKNFGENPHGPVDHSLPVIRITDPGGKRILGIVFNYACHCTTFGGNYNRVNGDWAGYAQKYLEEAIPGATALCTIGCGADANPQREEDKALELAKSQGKLISDEVKRLLDSGDWNSVSTMPVTSYGFAGLAHERPAKQDLNLALESSNPHTRRHAQVMLETWNRMGRLPETYPMPIQVWRFGDEFAMVFLGGEVVAEYALRIKKELAADSAIPAQQIWVSAYSNDVFGYVASERMRSEGGYEVDFSMIYYLLPGRWSSGTEDTVVKRVTELFESKKIAQPRSVEDAASLFSLPSGFDIAPIVAEPLVEDPINFAVDAKGRLWVVEMGDYPKGAAGKTGSRSTNPNKQPWDGEPGGRIKILTDSDGDGTYDSFSIFLDGLIFPTGVFPWREGAIISGAPDIFYAADVDGDGKADSTEVLYTGFKEANPQHRVNGFEYGLDGWLYLSGGTNNGEITCVKTGEKVRLSGRDLRIHPESGNAQAVSGDTQYGRCRDEFNRWYGNTNSEPLFQLVIDDQYIKRNPFIRSPQSKHYLTDPILNPPVYPTSRTLDRFNDLHTLDRFSSACAPFVFRNPSLGSELQDSALICEPVHNLISRLKIIDAGVAVAAKRIESERSSEFLASADNWFRPVRQMTGPDGGLWICDMYRHVIEHPEWIPESWQSSLDLYAGSNMGRIYRVTRTGQKLSPAIDFTTLDPAALVEKMKSTNGWIRDMAQQQLVHLDSIGQLNPSDATAIAAIAMNDDLDPRVRIQAIWTCSLFTESSIEVDQFRDETNSQVVANAVRALSSRINKNTQPDFTKFASFPDPVVQFEIALAADELGERRQSLLASLFKLENLDPWVKSAALSSSVGVSNELLKKSFSASGSKIDQGLINGLINTSLGDQPKEGFAQIVTALNAADLDPVARFDVLNTCLDTLSHHGIGLAQLESDSNYAATVAATKRLLESAIELAVTPESDEHTKSIAIMLLGHSVWSLPETRQTLLGFLAPQFSPTLQQHAVDSLYQLGDASALISNMNSVGPSTQNKIQSVLLSRPKSALALLDAIAENAVQPSQLRPSTIETLMGYRDQPVRERAIKLFESGSGLSRNDLVQSYQHTLSMSGDRELGKAVFQEHCANCHKLDGLGKDVGPSLEALASKDRAFVLRSILDPNAAVDWKYKSYNVLLDDGRSFLGLVTEESATSMTLALPDGTQKSILLNNIDEMRNSSKSFMPEGFERAISPKQMADLLEFVKPN